MRHFINNPFEQEYESENEIDDFDLDFIVPDHNPIQLHPSYLLESEDIEEDPFEWTGGDLNDPDFNIEDIEGSSEYSSDDVEDSDVNSSHFYETYYSSDEDEDDLDYVTFPANSFETSPEELNSANSDIDSNQSGEEL